MQNTSLTSSKLTYDDEELLTAWRWSNARNRYINSLLADGCSQDAASTQADFDFQAHARKVGERRTTSEDEIALFEHTNMEMELWHLWSSSNARLQHITALVVIGFSPKAAMEQADVDFKAHSSGFKGTPQDEIEAFEQYSREQNLRNTWQSSKTREKHIESLLAKGLSPEGASRQADVDFHAHAKELDKLRLTPEGKVEAFEEYFDSIFGSSSWEQNAPDISPESTPCREKSEKSELVEARKRDSIWRHLCHQAGLNPQEVIGQFDQTINSMDESRAVERFLFGLKEQFRAIGVSETVIEDAMRGFAECVGHLEHDSWHHFPPLS